ncbi:MAG: anaerobic glycerol-3-phosphate dehydrogenase subunit C [Desulfobacteraceae bacterium]|nr:anaerobic glycerol-3-phosphate dehydrogenase subunit C [Desulfobacteraceae bacterium]
MKKDSKHVVNFDPLRQQVAGEVHTDAVRRYMLSTDGSIFQKIPAGVVYPKSAADIQAVVRFAAGNGLSVHPRGAGSGLCGSCIGDGIVVDFSKFMNRLITLNLQEQWFECEPGFRLGELQERLKSSGLFFPPDPSSGEYACFGGMFATNASGAHSVKYGNVADYVLDAQVVFANGGTQRLSEIEAMPPENLPPHLKKLVQLYLCHADVIEAAYPPIACNVAGYNLRQLVQNNRLRLHRLLTGSEGALGIAVRLKFQLIKKPLADSLVVAYFTDIVSAARATQIAMKLKPSGIEIMDKSLLEFARAGDDVLKRKIPAGIDNVLLMEWDGANKQTCNRLAETIQRDLKSAGLGHQVYTAVSKQEKEKFWALRKAAVPILYKLKGQRKILALVEDAAVDLTQLVPYFKGIYAIFDRFKVPFVLYGHIAKGLMHTRPLLDLKNPDDVALLQPIADAVYELVDRLDGTVSGEHGDGRLRSAYLMRKYPEIYPLFQKTKSLLDPERILNPDIKSFQGAGQMAVDLRYGGNYQAKPLENLQLYWDKPFMQEVEGCHGCSKCTTITTATRMCPVFKFTRDEAASPKAKANVLRAMISGVFKDKDIYGQSFQNVMSQCINCGSCFDECPSNVNIPKLALEAKAQFVRKYGSALIDTLTANVETAAQWLHKLSPVISPLVNQPKIHNLTSRLTGLARQRPMVSFHKQSLYERLPRLIPGQGPKILYYAGCYAGYIRPRLGQAAIDVFKHMGMQIHLPPQHCCGLPHLSKAMVSKARIKAEANLKSWAGLVKQVDHIVVTCSSCGYSLIKDWFYLLDRKEAEQVSVKLTHISDLLIQYRQRIQFNPLPITIAYHQPCHLRLQSGAASSVRMLCSIPNLTVNDLQSHCCGMAGSWGLTSANYHLSKTIGSEMIQRLNTSSASYGVTDCPTCQMQMEHLGNLQVLHPIEVVVQTLSGNNL